MLCQLIASARRARARAWGEPPKVVSDDESVSLFKRVDHSKRPEHDAHISYGQGRPIAFASGNQSHSPALALEPLDLAHLLFRPQLRPVLVHL